MVLGIIFFYISSIYWKGMNFKELSDKLTFLQWIQEWGEMRIFRYSLLTYFSLDPGLIHRTLSVNGASEMNQTTMSRLRAKNAGRYERRLILALTKAPLVWVNAGGEWKEWASSGKKVRTMKKKKKIFSMG